MQSITLTSATRITPDVFPVTLGDIAAERAVLDASFTSSGLVPDQQYVLTVEGTYVLDGGTFGFVVRRDISLPLSAPGEGEVTSVSAEFNIVIGPFPPEDSIPGAEEGEAGPPLPIGPQRGSVTPTSPPAEILEPTVVDDVDLDTLRVSPQQVANPVIFVRQTPFGRLLGGFVHDSGHLGEIPPHEPSVASAGNIVLASGNSPYLALSTDDGRTFPIELRPEEIFKNPDNGERLCCDQVIHYVPQINRFVWVIITRPPQEALPNRVRLAVASPEDIRNDVRLAWGGYWDMPSSAFKLGRNNMGWPDLSVGNNFLYLSIKVAGLHALMVVRCPLHELANRQTLHCTAADPEKDEISYANNVVQNPGNVAFWASHLMNSTMRISSWGEDAIRPSKTNIAIKNWPNRLLKNPVL